MQPVHPQFLPAVLHKLAQQRIAMDVPFAVAVPFACNTTNIDILLAGVNGTATHLASMGFPGLSLNLGIFAHGMLLPISRRES